MGAINYHTSHFVTIGACIQDAESVKNDCISDGLFDPDASEDYIRDFVSDICQENYNILKENVESILPVNLDHFSVKIVDGYYEGFCIVIRYEELKLYPWEIEESIQETECIRDFLVKCVNMGLRSIYPGWCTTERNIDDSMSDIESGYLEMLQEIKACKMLNGCIRRSAS